ncbi:glycoside hydrolase family 19 protein [Spirosoma sp. HMF4905]|uniref:Glycoside hydrolase family 19 protein n=1 Tax=Spirosoma arboris TaxID=2682092 RepID=A0A7K1SKT8_9BACT|nr:glycoside hydrolase family 19 protein [Spirosoma arboris]MVM34432.1 glycoside hydrolase family 19 protein [Spirosoma arboris]
MKLLTTSILTKCGVSASVAESYVVPLNVQLPKYQINTLNRAAHFFSQITKESGGFTIMVENMNYSPQRLMQVWKNRFPTMEIAQQFAHNPEKLGNFVYANRLGNGPSASGDGYRYRGRGLIQCTGKDKYIDLTKLFGFNYIAHPEYMERPQDALLSALWFWQTRGLNAVADGDDVEKVTLVVNGGTTGLKERSELLTKCKAALAPVFA